MTAVPVAWGSAGSLGAELTESQAAFRVFAAAGGLVLLGLVLLLLTIWWWRGTRPESPALGPLEVMGDRRWASAAESERRRLLEEFRPEGMASRVLGMGDVVGLMKDFEEVIDQEKAAADAMKINASATKTAA